MILFNIMSVHGVVPDGFGVGIVIPVVKDKLGDITHALTIGMVKSVQHYSLLVRISCT